MYIYNYLAAEYLSDEAAPARQTRSFSDANTPSFPSQARSGENMPFEKTLFAVEVRDA